MEKVIIIGSGVSGLTSALELSKNYTYGLGNLSTRF